MPASRLCDPRTIISSLSRIRAAYFSSPQVNALRPPRRTCPLPRPPATQRYVCSRRVMTTRCLGVRTDEHGNSATIIQEPPQPLEETCRRVHERVQEFLKREYKNGERLRDVQVQTRRSLGVVGEALERYSLDELSLSYNGGKDCLVLLILYLCGLYEHFHNPRTANSASTNSEQPQDFPTELNTVYIPPPHPFPTVDAFIASSARTYHLTLSRHPYPMKSAFATYLSSHHENNPAHPIRAIFVGTRRTDPHGQNLTFFDPTDRGWPEFMRIHPVVEWHYAEIWAFIREVEVPYCGVYDEGFTSLGGTEDTRRNPKLRIQSSGDGEERYRPAYELVEDEEERLGRER